MYNPVNYISDNFSEKGQLYKKFSHSTNYETHTGLQTVRGRLMNSWM
jgi:hypothetical protein